jgi:hypothetical protein
MNNVLIEPLRVFNRNLKFRGVLSNKCVDILGNGPSLRDYKDDKGLNFIITCNEFHKTHLFNKIQSNLHLLVDPLYWLDPETHLVPVLKALIKLSIRPTILTNIRVLEFIVSSKTYQGVFRWVFIDFTEIGEYGFDISRPIKRIGQNVINIGIIFALFGSARSIRLFGVDMEILDMTEQMYLANWNWDHCWGKSDGDEGLKESFVKQGLGWKNLKDCISRMIFEFLLLKSMVDKEGCKVINMNKNSRLNVFEKIA